MDRLGLLQHNRRPRIQNLQRMFLKHVPFPFIHDRMPPRHDLDGYAHEDLED